MGTVPREVILPFLVCLQWGQLFKERICSPWSRFFSARVDPIWQEQTPFRKIYVIQGGQPEVMKVVPLCKSGSERENPFLNGLATLGSIKEVTELSSFE